MSDAENAFVEATDNLIRLYRGIERTTLDLPLFSVMPALIFFWALLRFYFFLIVGLLLIVPVNVVILIRNFFPGHWRYRPFFLNHLRYVWLWIWRGETPIAPLVFVRPVLNVFMKGHFERRLRRLRLEILLSDGLSDAARSTLLTRLDAALERWKSPRFSVIFLTVLLPAIVALPGSYKQLVEFLGLFEIRVPEGVVGNFVSEHMSARAVLLIGSVSLAYLVIIPITSFLGKRGLFLGADAGRICFPGGQEGRGVYSKEKEILDSVGIHGREVPIDFWLFGVSFVLSVPSLLLIFNDVKQSQPDVAVIQFWSVILQLLLTVVLLSVAVFRRQRTGRA
jgi:hypothetical protein